MRCVNKKNILEQGDQPGAVVPILGVPLHVTTTGRSNTFTMPDSVKGQSSTRTI